MKKLFLLFLISGGLLVASCTKRYDVVEPNQTIYADLTPSNWATTDAGQNYTTVITPPAGSTFDTNAGILIYFSFDNGQTYEQIPEVYNNVSFSYTYTNGVIKLFAQTANGTGTILAPQAVKVKIVLVASS